MAITKKDMPTEVGRKASSVRPAAFTLTPREKEILELQARGLLYKEIAVKLHVSEHTVNNHLYSIRQKLHAHNAIEAINAAFRLGVSLLK